MDCCRFCWQEIIWIPRPGEASVPVDPEAVYVIEGDGREVFFDDTGAAITGRRARPEEERPELPVAFARHRCLQTDKSGKGVGQMDLSTIKTCDLVQELSKREGVEKRIAKPYQDVQVRINGPAIVLLVID